jgi:hypothetical protein
MTSACRHDFASIIIALTLVAGLALSGGVPAHAQGAPSPPSPRTVVVEENGGPGSAANPILLPATEASAGRWLAVPSNGPIEFVLGPLDASFQGTPGRVLFAGGGAGGNAGYYRTCNSNVYTGGGVGVTIERSGGLYVDGGRVTLGDQFDVLGRGGSTGEYWATSAGLEIRF